MHDLTKQLLIGLQELKTDPNLPVIGGVYRDVFGIFIGSVLGTDVDLTLSRNLERLKEILAKQPSVSEKLDNLLSIYKVAQNQCSFGLHELTLDKRGGKTEDELKTKSADLIAKSTIYTKIAVNLPETHIGNSKIIQRLSNHVHLFKNILHEANLEDKLTIGISEVAKDAGAPLLSDNVVKNISKKAVEATKTPVGHSKILNTAALFVSFFNVLSQPLETDGTEEAEEKGEPVEKEVSFESVGGLIGFGWGLKTWLSNRKPKTQEASSRTPSQKPTSAPRAGLQSSSLKSFLTPLTHFLKSVFKKIFDIGLVFLSGGTSKILQFVLMIGGKLLSFLGGLFGGASDADVSGTLKKISLGVLLILLLPLFLIFGLSFFNMSILKPSALVTSLSVDQTPTIQKTVITPSSTTIINQVTPVSPPTTTFLFSTTPVISAPHGFPISSSCVTQPPNGTFSHKNLNAVDIGAIVQNNAWVVRSTHPGKVLFTGSFGNYGLIVMIESLDKRFITFYGHLRPGSISVKKDAIINDGTELGIVDNTGFSTNNHLHYELRGARNSSHPWGTKEGDFGRVGTILNFLPDCLTWSCQWYCKP